MAIALHGRLALALLLTAPAIAFTAPHAHAVSPAQACYKKFNAERKAGTIKGQTYKEFKATQCATPDAASATPTATAPATTPATTAPAAPASAPATAPATPAPAAAGNAVLPSAVSPKYSSESAGKARMHTCLDQYNANKTTNGNGGLKWIQKGGGYYSVCNAHLKG
ncbi:conserved hypothetical protein [Gluconacetobacter diazotrophicus PA1 5]|uniref:Uncharacterized protein n=2 Tax=Gluconacetobacter diazotrophicus TaxID=33996 RepID=A9HMD9_GLUDA|nr:hypothetical protein [Gluconacetobacter diazotrophicus]ACI50391.1 conserved hypothetical protein [Gluconacetobacter diazotrophicus PA1 5]MBB2156350.1 hypothetical protein [Gluconacetobacter diazotrophicus]TWB08314.1 hypothetical protein FBZ86_10750 [Gluconacetobacter diazotrophicus]CAP56296.1 conserved hypothetical protein [Gluconacetobacter diazotrophicus PA1 5]